MELSLQETYAPNLMCFGCGPKNPDGLKLRSFVDEDPKAETRSTNTMSNGGVLVAQWQPQPNHQAFDGILNGGIIGTLLDCHCNWAASWNLMQANEVDELPVCVTAEYAIKLHVPTPLDQPLTLHSWAEKASGRYAVVHGEITSGGALTASCHGTFIAVKEGHPAFHRW